MWYIVYGHWVHTLESYGTSSGKNSNCSRHLHYSVGDGSHFWVKYLVTGNLDRLVLAEDPPAFGEVYMLKYFQSFTYFILFSTRARNASCSNTNLQRQAG
jgi:hypothetical protein